MIKSNPTDRKMAAGKFHGFYRAVVEDNIDPKKMGRVRVRIWGLHTEKKTKTATEGIPTSELPWAEPCVPIMEGGISGFGTWGVPLQGAHVLVLFENGNYLQPRYFASLPGNPTEKLNPVNGFSDPTGTYPSSHRLNEPDWHRLARGDQAATINNYKTAFRVYVSTALGTMWSEPLPAYGTVYPHNFVIATHGGVMLEMDSSPQASRLHLYHPSNSYIEINHDGDMVIKNTGDKYEVTLGNSNEVSLRQKNITSGFEGMSVLSYGNIVMKGIQIRLN
jgi:hypothetical protein